MKQILLYLCFCIVLLSFTYEGFRPCTPIQKVSKFGNGEKKETFYYYKNCNLKKYSVLYSDDINNDYKSVEVFYTKDGHKNYESMVSQEGLFTYSTYTKFNNKGEIKLQNIYTYNYRGYLTCIETIRNGKSTTQLFVIDEFGYPMNQF